VTRIWQRVAALAPFLVAGTLLAGADFLDAAGRERFQSGGVDELLYYPSGIMVRQAALGYETAAADVAWLRGIQYYGEHRLTDQKFDMIGHVMDIVADLDPAFIQPYVFGAFVLAQEMKQPERGLLLLERGRIANPDDWQVLFEAGFLHYVCRHDYAAATPYFTWASRMPNHPEYVERFAAFSSQRAGNQGMATLLWKRVLATGNKYMQEVARRELDRLGEEGQR
jgi:hypothetical protein